MASDFTWAQKALTALLARVGKAIDAEAVLLQQAVERLAARGAK